jgi:hypothetical protein
MNKAVWEQVWPALRSLLQVFLGIAIGRGWVTAEQAATLMNDLAIIAPAMLSVGVVVYGIWKRSPTNLAKSAATVPGVEVRVDPMTAPASMVNVAADMADPANQNIKMKE